MLVLTCSLAGCAPEPAPREAPQYQLTVTDAGARYLDAVCPVNAAWDAVDVEVDRLRIALARGGEADARPFADAVRALGAASGAAGESLVDPSLEWPSPARGPVAEVGASLAADAEQAQRAAGLDASAAVGYAWEDAAEAAASAKRARTALGLPDDARLACAGWSKAG